MRLPRLSIDYYQFTLMIFILLLIAGIRSYITMPRTENPDIVMPGVSVIVIYPGAGPVDLEELVGSPIEEAINEIDDIKRINTSLVDGVASVSVEFDFDVDADKKYDEVVQKVNGIKNDLPEEILALRVIQWTSSDVAMLQLAMISDKATYRELEFQAEILKKEIEKQYGVKKVEIVACPEQEVRISLDLEKMAQMNISIEQVANALISNNANIPGGTIKLDDKEFGIRTSGSYTDLEQIRKTVVNSYMGKMINLEDIATVDFNYEDIQYIARVPVNTQSGVKTEKAIFIVVKQKEGLNILDIAKNVKIKINEFTRSLDEDIRLEYVFDQTIAVKSRINNLMGNLLQGVVLVGFIIFLVLGFRSSLVVILAIPLSTLIGLSFVQWFGWGLQQISIAGLVVVLGMLVDNSIVMVENINRFLHRGYQPREASIQAASEIGWPVVTSTLTTVVAFIPIAMMPHEAGLFIRSLPVTIVITLMVSLFVALTLTPMITSKLFTSPKSGQEEKVPVVQKYIGQFIEGPYRRILKYALNHKIRIVVFSVILLGISLFVFTYVGFSLFPKAEQPSLMVRIRLPESSNIEKTDQVARYVESVLDTVPEIQYYATNIGHGNPRIYYNLMSESYLSHYAEIFVATEEYVPDEFDAMVEKLRNYFTNYPGAKITIKEFEQGHPIDAPIQIYLTGKKLDVLSDISGEFEKYLSEQEGIVNIENQFTKSKTEIVFNINRDKANMFGVLLHVIDKTIRTAITGTAITKFRDRDGKEYNIVLRLPVHGKIKMEDINKIYVFSLTGKSIPLSELAHIEFKQTPSIINRYNMERTAEIRADVMKDYSIDEVMEPILKKLESYPFPSGYGYHIGGELESRTETFGGIGTTIIIAIIAIFAILVLQFRSFIQPLIIFVTIPFALIGTIWALFFTGYTFSFTAAVGLTSLAGIVVNNAILLVDYTNVLRRSGKSMEDALHIAGERRFTPIFLTSITTILGLLPMTLRGGTLWAPMGWTIMGGLFLSTALTLIMVPVLYRLLIPEKQPI